MGVLSRKSDKNKKEKSGDQEKYSKTISKDSTKKTKNKAEPTPKAKAAKSEAKPAATKAIATKANATKSEAKSTAKKTSVSKASTVKSEEKSTVKKASTEKEKKPVTSKSEKAPAKASKAKDAKPKKEVPASLPEIDSKAKKTGRFEIKKSKDGRFVFNLYAPNHIIVATSQVYSSSSAAVNGIQSIIANAEKAPLEDNSLKNATKQACPKWEIYIDKGGEYRFRLYATNGNCVVHSQGYTAKASCKNGIDSIIKCAKNAEIDKSYLKNSKL